MPQIPSSQDEEKRRREEEYIREASAELEESGRQRQADIQRRLNGIKANEEVQARLDKAEPLGPRPSIPVMGYDMGGGIAERRMVPDINDPIRDAPAVGASVWTPDLARPAAPEGAGPVGMGSGGPEVLKLPESVVLEFKRKQADAEAGRSAAGVRDALSQIRTTPEQVAKDIQLAQKTGANRLDVELNRRTYELADVAARLDAAQQTAPRLRSWMDSARENLEVAHDDIDSLEWWEQIGQSITAGFARTDALKAERGSRDGAGMGALTDYPLAGDLRPGVADAQGVAYGAAVSGGALKSGFATTTSGIYGLARSATEMNDQFASWVAGRKLDSVPSQWLAERQQAAKVSADEWMPKVDDPTLQGALQGIQSLPTSAFTIATGIMTGGTMAPLVGAAVAGGVTAGDEYGTGREQGMDPLSAAGYGVTQGILEAAWEVPQLKFLIGDLNKLTPFGEMMFKQGLVQVITEQGATHTQDFVSWALLPVNRDKTIDDYIAERPAAAYQTLIASMVGTGVQTTTAKLLDEGLKAVDQGYQQKRAEEIANMVRAMGDKAADSKLLKRMPDKYREAVTAITKDGPIETIRIDSEAFSELAQTSGVGVERLAQAFRIDAAEALTAIEAGQDVVIPSGNYAAVIQTAKKEIGIGGAEIHTAFAPNIRLRADDFTAKEVEAMKQIAADEQAAREASEGDTSFADAADRVREDSRQRLASTGRFNAETTAIQSSIPAEFIITLAERTGQDPEALWKDFAARAESKLKTEEGELAQSMAREPVPIDDRELELASKELEPKQFEAWKAAREGLSNEQIAERMNEAEPDAVYTPEQVKQWLFRARGHGYDSQKASWYDRGLSIETQRVINMKARGVANKDIATALYPDKDTKSGRNQVGVLVNRHKALIAEKRQALTGELAQEQRGGFTGMNLSQEAVIRLYESANLSTFVHETAHWYLTTLEKMGRMPDAHPFVIEQLAAVRNWAGKHPEFQIYDEAGQITPEGVEVQEMFAETFEAYLREGKAPSSAMRSVFAAFKSWLLRVYKQLTDIGGRVRLDAEITAVFDRALATDEAITAARKGMDQNATQMAQAMLDKGVITQKQFDRTKARLLEAKEKAEADLMARLMEQYERNQKTWWREEERDIRRDVQSEIDERPEQRAYAWLAGDGWRDTLEDHVEQAASAATVLELAQADGYLGNSAMEAKEWIEARAKGLDMSDAARARRAKELGFTKRFFHETKATAEELSEGFSTERRLASIGDSIMPIGVFVKPGKGGIGIGGNQVELLVRPGNSQTFETREELEAHLREDAEYARLADEVAAVNAQHKADYKALETAWDKSKRASPEWFRLNDQINAALREWDNATNIAGEAARVRATEVLKAQGLNSITVNKDVGSFSRAVKTTVVLDPKDLRSPDAAFDPDSRDSARLLSHGGDGSVGALFDPAHVDTNATDESLMALRSQMMRDGRVPLILLFKTTEERIIAFPGVSGDYGMHHDQARDMLGLGDLKLQHGVWNPKKWPTLETMNASDLAWYDTTGMAKDDVRELAQDFRQVLDIDTRAIPHAPDSVTVIKNPTKSDLARLSVLPAEDRAAMGQRTTPLRYVHSENGDLYAWRGDIAIHDDIIAKLGIKVDRNTPRGGGGMIEMKKGEPYFDGQRIDMDDEELAQLKSNSFRSLRNATDQELDEWFDAEVILDQDDNGARMLLSSGFGANDIEINLEAGEKHVDPDTFTGFAVDMYFQGRLGAADDASAQTARQAQAVFARTVAALQVFVRREQPQYIVFTGSGDAQQKLYDFMLRSFQFGGYEARVEVFANARIEMGRMTPAGVEEVKVFHLVRPDMASQIPIDLENPRVAQATNLTTKNLRYFDIVRPPVRGVGAADTGRGEGRGTDAGGNAGVQQAGQEGELAQLAGRRSAAYPADQETAAAAMERDGADVETIWKTTGMFRSVDGMWRYEIDDGNAKLLPKLDEIKGLGDETVPLSEVLRHPDLFKAYPELADIKVHFGHNDSQGGSYSGVLGLIEISIATKPRMLSVLLHETQHAIQDIEGFANGGGFSQAPVINPRWKAFQRAINENPKLAQFLKDRDAIRKVSDKAETEMRKLNEGALALAIEAIDEPDLVRAEKMNDEARSIALETSKVITKKYPEVVAIWKRERELIESDELSYDLPDKYLAGRQVYMALAGEVEARNVQTRHTMLLDNKLARSPAMTQDEYYADIQIVRLASGRSLAQGDPSQEGSSKLLAQTRTAKGRTAPPPGLSPMRLDLRAVEEQYGPEALAALPPKVRAFSANATDADQFVELARDISQTLKKKKPKSLWKFLSTKRQIGEGNDKISYSGIRDDGGEIFAMIGAKKEAPGLIADKDSDGKRARSYSIEEAARAAWEEGYFNGDVPPGPAEFLDALRGDFDGTAKVYTPDGADIVAQIENANEWANWFDQNEIDINEESDTVLRATIETKLSSQAENAIGPDEAAPFFKMPDGRALLEGLKQGPQRDKLIREETRRRMIERHGDIFNDGTIMQAAEAFARNEVQQRQYEIELEALSNASGKQAATNLARETAKELLRDKQVREVLNYNQWLILEQRWGKKALEAAEKGDFAKAAEAKRYQLINSAVYREAQKLAEKIEKAVKHAKSFDGRDKRIRIGKAGNDYLQQIDQILEGYEFKPVTRKREQERVELRDWFAAKQAAMDPMFDPTGLSEEEMMAVELERTERSAALAAMQSDANVRNYKSITTEELMAVRDQLDMIERTARRANALLVEGERRHINLAIDDIEAQAIIATPKELPPESYASYSPKEKQKRGIKQFFSEIRTMQAIVRIIDGIDNGPLAKNTIHKLNTAGAERQARMRLEEERVVALFREAYGINLDVLRKDQMRFPGIDVPLAKMERLTIALYWGTEISRKRIMDGYGWDAATVQNVLNTLDETDWRFVRSVWDYVGSLYPEHSEAHQDIHGVPIGKQPGLPIVTRYGVIDGNYFPIRYNPYQSSRADQQALTDTAKQIMGRAGTRKATGSTKERVKGKVTMPVLLDLYHTLAFHVNEVVDNITMQRAVLDAGRIIAHPRTQQIIVKRHGWVTYKTLMSAMKDTRNGLAAPNGPTEQIATRIRNGATNVTLGLNIGTVIKQLIGFTATSVRLGGPRSGAIGGLGWMLRGAVRMGFGARGMQNGVAFILERSPYMRVRMQIMNQAIADQQRRINEGNIKADLKRGIDIASFFMIQRVQFLAIDSPTWLGAFEKFTASGMSEKDAAASADQIVIDSQGSGELWQVSAFQRGGPIQRIFTNYITAAIANWNLAANQTKQTNFRNPGQVAIWAMNMGVLMTVPVILSMAVAHMMSPGGDDDDEPLEEQFIREQISFLLGPLGLFGQMSGAAAGFAYKGPQGTRWFQEASKVISETFTGSEKLFAGDATADDAIDILRPANMAAGVWFGYPAAALDRFVRGGWALVEGDTQDPKALIAGPPRE